jgi:hypothetical protein
MEPPRDGQILGNETVSTATPDGIRNALEQKRSRAARGGSMYEHVSVPLDGSEIAEAILPFIEKERGSVRY